MTYSVKEIFYTLQGEGVNTGRAAVFCRFSGCNLWSGREADRSSAVCTFCDTEFVGTDGTGGGRFHDADGLADAIATQWQGAARRFVVLTGGEPALQVDAVLVDALHGNGFSIAIETNGTLTLPPYIDWLCVSPKADTRLRITRGHELKLVYPQLSAPPERFEDLPFDHFFLQPMDGPERQANTTSAIHYCMNHPQWRLSVQTHKMIGLR